MPTTVFLLGITLLFLVAGCGEATIPVDEAYDPAKLQGAVDTTLPPEQQQKQQAIVAIVELLQRGIEVDILSSYLPDIQFQESFEEFLPSGAIDLHHWDFDGQPTGDDVPVVMHFRISDETNETTEVKRVYTVTGSGGKQTIRRNK